MRKTVIGLVLAGVVLAGCSAQTPEPDAVRVAWIEGCTVAGAATSGNDDVTYWYVFCTDFYDDEVAGGGLDA